MNATERGIREQFSFWSALSMNGAHANSADAPYAVVGCGTSVHIADSIAVALNECGFLARPVPGNEWTTRRGSYIPMSVKPRVIALSRSGESTETVAAASASQKSGLPVTAFTCAPGSSLCQHADELVESTTHPEEGIVMTASASLMLLMGLRYAGVAVGADDISEAELLLNTVDSHLKPIIEGRSHFVFLGGGALYGVAREGALKLQEMSLSQSEAHHPLEYRHGPVSLIDERSVVIIMYHPDTTDEEALLARELMSKGARVLGLGGPGTMSFPVKASNAGVRALVCLPVLQLLGEYVARSKGLDTLAPRHLTKVVTIENTAG